jgi:endonuclease III
VQRVGRRLGFFEEGTNVANIEKRLMALLPQERWCMISHLLIWHGRRACKARGARCSEHPVCAKYGVGCENWGK